MQPPTGTVTFLFTDIEGSTRLWEERPDEMRAALAEHDALLRAVFDAHGGYVFATGGDGFAVAFSRAHDAVDAAAKAQAALADHPLLRVRMGIHTGEVQERDGDYFGPAVNRAGRVMAIAHGGQVVLTQATRELCDGHALVDLGEHRLRDLSRPTRVYQLGDRRFARLRSIDAAATNLPLQLTELVGRALDIATVTASLSRHRVVTLTGVGGVGKTRLAMHVAAEVVGDFPAGVWLVELAALADDDSLAAAVAAVLGVQRRPGMSMVESLIDYLSPREVLLVLDNCEHLLEGAANVVDGVTAACAGVRFLATSRESLNVSGEWVHRVPSLELPKPGAAGSSVLDAASVELFVDRVAAGGQSIALDDIAARAIAEIARRLDGIPLALELAAARVSSLGVAQVAAHLDERFRLLTGGPRTKVERHRTLRSAVQWSYDLLSVAEQMVFARLSVFAGGFTPEAALTVVADESIAELEVLDALGNLVSKSMIVADHRGAEVCYRMLETLRQFAAEELQRKSESDVMRSRHASYFAAFADRIEPGLCGPDEADWVRRLEFDFDNLRSAFDWAESIGDHGIALRLALACGRYGWGRIASGALSLPARAAAMPGIDDHALFPQVSGWAAYERYVAGDHAKVVAIVDRARISAATNGGHLHSWAMGTLAISVIREGDARGVEFARQGVELAHSAGTAADVAVNMGAVCSHCEQLGLPVEQQLALDAVALARSIRNPSTTALTLMQVAQCFPMDAEAFLSEALAAAESVGNVTTEAWASSSLAQTLVAARRAIAAIGASMRSLALHEQSGNRTDIFWAIDTLARAMVLLGVDESAAILLGASTSGPFRHAYIAERQMAMVHLANRLGAETMSRLVERGQAMPVDQLVIMARAAAEHALREDETVG